MPRIVAVCTLIVAGIFGLASCASTPAAQPDSPGTIAQSDNSPATSEDDSEDPDSDSDTSAGTAENTIPEGALAASPEFPFPVPEGWDELDAFAEEKIGKKMAMSATYAYPGDAKTAAATYEQLLKAAGFDAYPYPLGEVTNDASLIAEGAVNGVAYKGTLDFDTDSEGIARVAINLTQN